MKITDKIFNAAIKDAVDYTLGRMAGKHSIPVSKKLRAEMFKDAKLVVIANMKVRITIKETEK